MSSAEAVLWLVARATAVALIGYVWRQAVEASSRRARRARYQSHETKPQPLASRPGTLSGSMGRDRAAGIRRNAEAAALMASRGRGDAAGNPYPEGSPEFVLWVATFHLALTEIAEQEAADSGDPAAARTPVNPR